MNSATPHGQRFTVLLEVLKSHYHPDVYTSDSVQDLHEFCNRTVGQQPRWVQEFLQQLSQALAEERENLDHLDIFAVTLHAHGSDREFLEVVWEDLFPDESVPAVND